MMVENTYKIHYMTDNKPRAVKCGMSVSVYDMLWTDVKDKVTCKSCLREAKPDFSRPRIEEILKYFIECDPDDCQCGADDWPNEPVEECYVCQAKRYIKWRDDGD